MWRDTLRGWRAFALIFFLFVAGLEFLEVIGDLLAFFELTAYAQFSGIAPEMEAQRLTSLVILSAAITGSAAVTAYGISRKKNWTVRAGTISGIVLVVYAVYQILSALFVLTVNTLGVMFAGATFGALGLLAMWLVRRGTHESTPYRKHP